VKRVAEQVSAVFRKEQERRGQVQKLTHELMELGERVVFKCTLSERVHVYDFAQAIAEKLVGE
jgi:hypothetical protein